jgi:LysM repeat protein
MPTATPAAIVTPDGPPRYTVQPGDTLATIARQFETTVEAIIALNQLADPNQIEVGQQLVLPAPGGTAAPADGP